MAKGAAYEREICKLLSRWWTGGLSDNVFWRTSNSGGRATMRRKQGKDGRAHASDVGAIDHVGQPFVQAVAVEIKRGYTSCTLQDLLDNDRLPTDNWLKWIAQAENAMRNSEARSWMLIIRRDGRKAIAIMPTTMWCLIGDMPDGMGSVCLNFGGTKSNPIEREVFVCRLEDYLEEVPPDRIKEAFK